MDVPQKILGAPDSSVNFLATSAGCAPVVEQTSNWGQCDLFGVEPPTSCIIFSQHADRPTTENFVLDLMVSSAPPPGLSHRASTVPWAACLGHASLLAHAPFFGPLVWRTIPANAEAAATDAGAD